MPTAGVVIDDYKLEVFKRHLEKDGFKYTQHPGLVKGTLLLKVECESQDQLKPTIMAAQQESALLRWNPWPKARPQ